MAYSKQNFQDGQILTAANLEKMENGIIAGQGAKNLLVNSDFTNVINSKGLSSYEGQVEGIDGWTGRVIAQKVEVESTDVKISATGTAYAAIRQKIVKIPKLVRKTITFAAKLYSNVDADIRIADAGENMLAYSINPAGQTNILIVNYTVPSGATADTVVPTIMLRTQASGNYMKLYWAALYEGVYDASTLPPYIPKGKHVEMLNCNVPLAPHNLLDNSDFRNPVNQRGIKSGTTVSAWKYHIDRWNNYHDADGTISFNTNGIVINMHMGQVLNPDSVKTGTVVTAAVKWNDGTIQIARGTITRGNAWTWFYSGTQNGSLVGVIDNGDNRTSIFVVQSDGRKTLVWAALYEGSYDASTLPAYQPKGYAAELAACRYYYQVIPEQTSCSFATSAQSSKYFASSINFPPMRITPTVSLKTDNSGYIGVVQGVSFVSASEFDFVYKLNGTLLPATTNANYAGKVMSLYGVELSADL